MKKIVYMLISILIISSFLVGCGDKSSSTNQASSQASNKTDSQNGNDKYSDLFFNNEYDKEQLLTINGKKFITDENKANVFADRFLGMGFEYSQALKDAKDDEKINVMVYLPYGLKMFYYSDQASDLLGKYSDEEYEKLTDSEREDLGKEIKSSILPLLGIFRYDDKDESADDVFKEWKADFQQITEFMKHDTTTYYIAYNDDSTKDFLKESEKEYLKSLINDQVISDFKSNMTVFTPADPDEDSKKTLNLDLTAFTAKTMDGKDVDASIFKGYNATMINIWATDCNPCIKEMPELEALHQQLPEDVNIISICLDANEEKELAEEIISKSGVTFTTLALDDEWKDKILKEIPCTPTTFFVNEDGIVISLPQLGVPMTKDSICDSYMELVKPYTNQE